MKKALFLYNPQSGRGRIERNVDALLTLLGRRFEVEAVPIDFTRNPFEGRSEIEAVIVAGGDGTVNYAVNRMKQCGRDLQLGVIPAGTANDFAGALGMSKDPIEAARQIADGAEERIDCGRVNDLYFVNVFSFGIFTTTSQRTSDERKHRIGKLAYLIEGVKELRALHTVPLRVTADGASFSLDSLMVLVFNGETAGGFRLARRSSIQDGMFDCLMLERRNFFRSTWAMGRYLLGGKPRIVRELRARRIEIASTVDEPTDIDGQKGAEFPLAIECLEGELRVLCPPRRK